MSLSRTARGRGDQAEPRFPLAVTGTARRASVASSVRRAHYGRLPKGTTGGPTNRNWIPKRGLGLVLGALVTLLTTASLRAQTPEDGLMMSKRSLCTGFLYSHDSWSEYWEGTLERGNGNIGRVTTESIQWYGVYGITDRVNVAATVPYVETGASAGTLHGMKGFQDLTLAAKFTLLTKSSKSGTFRTFVVGSLGLPLTDYTPDFLPLSIGLGSRRAAGRLTLNYQAVQGWYFNGSASYTRRGNIHLDREAYYTDGQLYLTDEVAMPDAFDWVLSAGYVKGRWQAPLSVSQQITLGGGDIRRQDMPFPSNRMIATRVEALVMYTIPKAMAVRVAAAYTVDGRNVGKATTLTAGLLYTVHF